VFDTVTGLPLHALVVHAVVVLLPLACLVTIAVAARPSWRRFAPALVALNAVVAAMAFVAKRSGENLAHRIEQFGTQPASLDTHFLWGARLVWMAAGLLAVAVVLWLTHRTKGLANVVAVVAVLGSLATIGVTGVVGHSGATAVWKDTIANTKAP
jgi:hypothetical protein